MLQRVSMDGIELPRLYIAETKEDVDTAVEAGIPFVRWRKGNDALVKIILRPVLEKMFPHILWNAVLGKRKGETIVVETPGWKSAPVESVDEGFDNDAMIREQRNLETRDICEEKNWLETAGTASDKREFNGGGGKMEIMERESILSYTMDRCSCVDIEVLQKLGMLPKFLGDIVDCVKLNLSNRMRWTEGYTKKLGVPLGTFKSPGNLPNLIILDVSGSIPRGISATMLAMIDTLRSQVGADLIITSSNSVYYPMGCELPNPQQLRNSFDYGNEARQFYAILNKYVAGRKWGHVISFGDNDCPAAFESSWYDRFDENEMLGNMSNTSVKAVHHYHTQRRDVTGYAKWVHELLPSGSFETHYDTSWCNVIVRR